MNKSEIRSQFPHIDEGLTYLNHAAISPLSNRVASGIRMFLENRNSGQIDNFEEWMELMEEVRSMIAQLIHSAGTDRILFVGNTSEGLSAVAGGIQWEKGDEIILNTMEFPANIHPFRILEKKGVKIKYLQPDDEGKITPEIIEKAIHSRTKMLSISAVQYLNGFRADLKAIGKICNANDIYFVVDGIQALGAVSVNVRECHIDALASGTHKWLMSPMGIGFLYISEKLAGHLTPFKTGWLSVENPWEIDNFEQKWKPVPSHLEIGTSNMLGLAGLHASLKFLSEIGMDQIYPEILKNTQYLLTNVSLMDNVKIITPTKADHHAGIVTFKLRGKREAGEIVDDLQRNHITISARQGYIRISPHFYNSEKDLNQALDCIFK